MYNYIKTFKVDFKQPVDDKIHNSKSIVQTYHMNVRIVNKNADS